ncbi:MAG TPA: NAD-dependent epimerase/dehydratase family protein [Bacteroidota bacterium]|nr:NAD-dependent epimerase/dehydratase family protein [Bacteroidota bacterium]
MNILITGGAGFIGSSIADAYRELGHELVIVDNLSTGVLDNVPKGAAFYQMDIRDEGLADVVREHNIDIINHHAAQIDVRKSVEDPRYDLAVNVLGSINVIEAALAHGVKRLIFASSGGAGYGEQVYFPADEQHPIAPCSPYGITKVTVERYLHYYHQVRGLTYTTFRYTNVYGPRQNPHGEAGVVAIFCDKLLRGQQPVINGDGGQTRDYVYIDDVVRANVRGLEMEGSDTLNVCTARETSVNDIFRTLNDALGAPAKEVHGPAKDGEQQRSVCSFEKIRSLHGWEPRMSMDEGLRRTMQWFRERFEQE